ncbi:MAG: AraC family transcriptional regulator [Opitutaceae bacterium]|jgi:AraC family transcriptional regulator|nr:AraC family transcriptional regulator [Opitutaceae bacterium]
MPANHTPDSAPHHPQSKIQLPDALHSWRQDVFYQGGVAVLRERLRSNQFAWHRHDQLQLLLVLGDAVGEAEWKNHDGEPIIQRLTGDTVWMVPPGQAHALDWSAEAELIVLYCDREWSNSFGKKLTDVSVEPLASYVQHNPLVGELCVELRQSCHDRNPRPDDVAALGLALATRLLRSHCAHFPQGPKRWNMLPASIRRLLDHIDQHLEEDLSTSVLAGLVGLSENYLSEVFRDHTGLPPQLYVIWKRIARAKELLPTGNYTVGEVAYLTGFSDQAHLDRHFRQLCGAPPSVWLSRLEPEWR